MAVYNTTYNFNQERMNFGQAMLYGALGSLTGGMGCMGGGYGMGMGMYGSIFPMAGMGGFGYGCGGFGNDYYESMLTMQLGNLAAGMIVSGVNHALEGKGGKKNIADRLESIINEASEHLEVLGSKYSLEDGSYKNAKVEDNYNKNVESANQAISGRLGTINTKLTTTYADANKPVKAEGEDDTKFSERLTKWEQDKAALEAEKAILLAKTDSKNELVKALLDAQKALEARKAEIDNAIKALNPLKTEYDELMREQNSKALNKELNKADGTSLSRMKNTPEAAAQNALCDFRKAQKKWMNGDHSETVRNQLKSAYKKINKEENKTIISNKYDSILSSIDSWLTQEKINVND